MDWFNRDNRVVTVPEVKRQGREINTSPAPSAEFKNDWSYISAFPVCLHGAHRDNFNRMSENSVSQMGGQGLFPYGRLV
jgi:hypothetical protein